MEEEEEKGGEFSAVFSTNSADHRMLRNCLSIHPSISLCVMYVFAGCWCVDVDGDDGRVKSEDVLHSPIPDDLPWEADNNPQCHCKFRYKFVYDVG